MSAVFDRRRVPAPESSYSPLPFEQVAGPSRRTDRSADEARPICKYLEPIDHDIVLQLTFSPQDRSHLSGERQWIHRIWRCQDSMLSVRTLPWTGLMVDTDLDRSNHLILLKEHSTSKSNSLPLLHTLDELH
jgi:hypothetical protein